MSMEWIKVCKDTPYKRELAIVAEIAQLSDAEAFWYWFKLYSWADDQTTDGFVPHFTLTMLSRNSGIPLAICQAFAAPQVGWIFDAPDGDTPGIMFKNWEYHNGDSAKKRAAAARRASRYRANNTPPKRASRCKRDESVTHSVTKP